ncbi:MAG: DNA polymerase III subunit delta' [Lachnospiraceae bacterium]|nr:DNA polymerase III subunit delta' [Lachnospiraceae bacterium]
MSGYSDVAGHFQVIEYMRGVIKEGMVPHAFLFSGPEGTGKSVLAGIFARALQCEEGGTDPCGKCRSCIQAESGNHPDIMWVKGSKQGIIGVDDIREKVNDDICIKPYSSRYKIYIIDDAETMTPGAQNALLKTIEEPPEYGIIMLLANNKDSLLSTVRSRCVLLSMRPVDDKSVLRFLKENYDLTDEEAQTAAAYAGGSIGKAVKLIENDDYREIRRRVLHLVRGIDSMEIYELKDAIKEITAYNISLPDIIDMMMIWYRDVLMLKATNDIGLLNYRDEYKYLKQKRNVISYEGLDSIIGAMEKAKSRLRANVEPGIVMEMLLMNIKENQNDR